jgi:hypothetical protein
MHSHNEVNAPPNPFETEKTVRSAIATESALYAAGNPPTPYAAIPHECAYAELDRDHSRLTARLGVLRGELADARADLKTARSRAWWLGVVVGLYTAGGLLAVGVYLLR